MSVREKGVVKWFDDTKGYGFVQRESGADAFVHYSSVQRQGHARVTLAEGQRLEFTITQGKKGLQAEDVVILD